MTGVVAEQMLQLVVFSLGDEEFALPIASVQEIIRYTEPRGIASELPWNRGVISLRGKIIPVCDLAQRLEASFTPDERSKIIVVENAAGAAGVVVDDVEEVLTVEAEQLEPLPSVAADFVEAVAKVGERLIVLLDCERLLAGIEHAERLPA